ncbi:hypothetical protein SDC9_113066 [bioreactor metagenome]|uniref:Uncharacterized protein n=1 Tax=bioreactor metagenome TaxID=1076179 RepID=A0A645BL23_9ZZZZ
MPGRANLGQRQGEMCLGVVHPAGDLGLQQSLVGLDGLPHRAQNDRELDPDVIAVAVFGLRRLTDLAGGRHHRQRLAGGQQGPLEGVQPSPQQRHDVRLEHLPGVEVLDVGCLVQHLVGLGDQWRDGSHRVEPLSGRLRVRGVDGQVAGGVPVDRTQPQCDAPQIAGQVGGLHASRQNQRQHDPHDRADDGGEEAGLRSHFGAHRTEDQHRADG